jgi:hypothetical protein
MEEGGQDAFCPRSTLGDESPPENTFKPRPGLLPPHVKELTTVNKDFDWIIISSPTD